MSASLDEINRDVSPAGKMLRLDFENYEAEKRKSE